LWINIPNQHHISNSQKLYPKSTILNLQSKIQYFCPNTAPGEKISPGLDLLLHLIFRIGANWILATGTAIQNFGKTQRPRSKFGCF
jgi:hypothetical protein